VHAVANALAEIDVNITDLNTRLIHEEGEQPLYAMMLEVAPPPGLDRDELEDRLRKVAGEQRLEVSVRELATDSL
jgi:predicted amino acid-binding ACT domain protein